MVSAVTTSSAGFDGHLALLCLARQPDLLSVKTNSPEEGPARIAGYASIVDVVWGHIMANMT